MYVLRVRQQNSGQETSPGRRWEVGGYTLGKEYLRSLATLLQWYIKSNGLRMGLGSSFCIRSHTPKLNMAKERRWRGQGAGCLPPV